MVDHRLLDRLIITFRRVVMNLYLDNPDTGEFEWSKIRERLPLKSYNMSQKLYISPATYENNIAAIMGYASFYSMNIVRRFRGGKYYYKVQNIEEAMDAYHRAENSETPKPTLRKTYPELWAGSGIVGPPVDEGA